MMEPQVFHDLVKAIQHSPPDVGWNLVKEYRERENRTKTTAVRMYSGAKQSRLTASWGQTTTSADYELATSLRTLRSRSRQMIRDAPYAKRAKVIVVNNVIGPGIGMQAQVKTTRDQLNNRVNDDIEAAWEKWCEAESCHTGGSLHFADIERMAMGQIFETGEIFLRKYYRKFGGSSVPYALEIIEPERVLDEFQPSALLPDAIVRLGVEADRFRRPVAYWIRLLHPGEIRYYTHETDAIERIPADQIMHLRIIDRWPQTRGEPWLHTALRKLNDVDGYSEAEIIGARAAAAYMGVIETELDYGDKQADGSREIALEPGIVERLNPREKFNFVNPQRPNSQADPFLRFMLREIAAGTGVSYESLSRDYSQSNYSSSRLALLDDRDLWRMLQLWIIRTFRYVIHREWMQQAVLAGALRTISPEDYALAPEKFEVVRFKPRGWSWIDPTKEVQAYKEAIKAGLTTMTSVIAQTAAGADIEDILNERSEELKMAHEKGLVFDTDPLSAQFQTIKSTDVPPAKAPPEDQAKTDQAKADQQAKKDQANSNQMKAMESYISKINDRIDHMKPEIKMPDITFPPIDIQPPSVNVTSPAIDLHLNIDAKAGRVERTVHFGRDEKGDMRSPFTIIEEEKE